MTEQQIIETLATKVMGWDMETVWLTGWNPVQNIHDAWMVVEQMVESENRSLFDHYIDSNYFITEVTPKRICEAALVSAGVDLA